jgi:hypothetical protein
MTQQAPKRRRPIKPETVLRKLRDKINLAREWNNLDRGTGNYWVEVNQALLAALGLVSEAVRASRSQQKGRRP